jgi:hypothetical protein
MEDIINYKQLYEQYFNENIELKNKIVELTEHLKKYTSHKAAKTYYQKNKDIILEKNKEYVKAYREQLPSEKIKEYNKRAYEKRKNKHNQNIDSDNNSENK